MLRRRRPLLERPYRTWGYPFVPMFFIITYSYIAVQIFISSPVRSVLGIVITISGIPFYLYAIRREGGYAADAVAVVPSSCKDD